MQSANFTLVARSERACLANTRGLDLIEFVLLCSLDTGRGHVLSMSKAELFQKSRKPEASFKKYLACKLFSLVCLVPHFGGGAIHALFHA